jgi:hypothetical protein
MVIDLHAREIRQILKREGDHSKRAISLFKYVARQPDDQHLACVSILVQELVALQALVSVGRVFSQCERPENRCTLHSGRGEI